MPRERIQDDAIRQRLFLIREAQKYGVKQSCLRWGKHRSYYYYWIKRYQKHGWRGLADRSKRPKRSPRRTAAHLEARVKRYRLKTGYGKERIAPLVGLPASTVGNILSRLKIPIKRRKWKTQKKRTRCYNLLTPGQRVQMDVKYVPFRIKGKQYYQYTIIDECTRMRYLEVHDSIWTLRSVEVLERARKYFGFPVRCVQTDNGTEFTFKYTAELTAKNKKPKEHPLDTYCRKHKIKHRLIPPGEKELNGKVERSHRTDDEEFYRRFKTKPSIQELKTQMKRWMNFYNSKRNHSAIAHKTPLQFMKERTKQKRSNKHAA